METFSFSCSCFLHNHWVTLHILHCFLQQIVNTVWAWTHPTFPWFGRPQRGGLDTRQSPLRDILGLSLPSTSHTICRGLPSDPRAGGLSALFPEHSGAQELLGPSRRDVPREHWCRCNFPARLGLGPSTLDSQRRQRVACICLGALGPQGEAEDPGVGVPITSPLTWQLIPCFLLLHCGGQVPILLLQAHILPSARPLALPWLAPLSPESRGSSSCPLNMSWTCRAWAWWGLGRATACGQEILKSKMRWPLPDLEEIYKTLLQHLTKICVYTAIFKMDNQQGPTVQLRELCQCYMAAWMGGKFRGEWVHVYEWLSPLPVCLKLSQCC